MERIHSFSAGFCSSWFTAQPQSEEEFSEQAPFSPFPEETPLAPPLFPLRKKPDAAAKHLFLRTQGKWNDPPPPQAVSERDLRRFAAQEAERKEANRVKTPFSRILYGGDYNPNQWPREVWDEDMKLFRQAGINSATINVFSWAKLQPNEETFDFSELDDIVEMLSRENYDIVMATSTAALPAWMTKNYPEVCRVDYEGRRHKFGHRHNHCPNSLAFRKFASAPAATRTTRTSPAGISATSTAASATAKTARRHSVSGCGKNTAHWKRSTRPGIQSSGVTPFTNGTKSSRPTR